MGSTRRESAMPTCILIDESHNFRNDKSNRYLALDEAIQRNGGRGRDGERKKVILLSATPINNDLYDLANQMQSVHAERGRTTSATRASAT